ncbi:UDP-4-amino-4,6-dideoxy-N-acetyl-beta-L-altrosamine N-acetyltransferase [Pandoraea sp. B-6]|uniref:UDP-4-amino-4, 6-dideoxy-N-acetyl-beta-L-altrosamine N-acetyltransferase n=1 Tax=Pandoraea sp. B-6 TaxID=1204340 RepID=UPI00034C4C70|nr:UDP-4-amino-4,6-dideoxy-N-acetyl-beta-L-altrosamine N-acetyltransferase [Pandoraea sp. B-6]
MSTSESLTIRPMRSADLGAVLAWRNRPEVRHCMFTDHEISLEEHTKWFSKMSNDASRRLLIVEDREVPLGFVNYSNVTPGAISDWGFYAAADAPRGSGKRLGAVAIAFAFESLKLHKICGQALDFNEKSIRMHLSLGFTREGVLRDQHLKNGFYHDLICFGLLRSEYHIANTPPYRYEA